jgi:multiple sugar transport system ATP-binding protein
LVLGARPENIHPSLEKVSQQVDRQLEGLVDFCEPLGSETVIHFRVGGQELLAMCDSDSAPVMNRRIGFSIEMEKIHLFDPASGSALF